MDQRVKNILFTEKYRPEKLDDCILPSSIERLFKGFIKKDHVPSLLLHGSYGVGKTTSILMLLKELNNKYPDKHIVDYRFINASLENGIDNLRDACTSFSEGSSRAVFKCIIFDEGDGLSSASQEALRGFVEKYWEHVTFVFTANNIHKILGAVALSRLQPIDFTVPSDEVNTLCKKVYERLKMICDIEGITYNNKITGEPDVNILKRLVMRRFPDIRSCIRFLHICSYIGEIDLSLMKISDTNIGRNIIDSLFSNESLDIKFDKLKEMILTSNDDMLWIYSEIYNILMRSKIPNITLYNCIDELNDGQKSAVFVPDKKLNLMASMVKLLHRLQENGC